MTQVTVLECSKITGIKRHTLYARIKTGKLKIVSGYICLEDVYPLRNWQINKMESDKETHKKLRKVTTDY